jgi:hypothetical protein
MQSANRFPAVALIVTLVGVYGLVAFMMRIAPHASTQSRR